MTSLSDDQIAHLRDVTAAPELPSDRYEIVREVASGGMGTVYLAVDRQLERRVAVKVLRDVALGEEGRARLLREARILARLEHPGIVPVHDVGVLPSGGVFYAMKLVEGVRLGEHVRDRDSLRERLRIFERICDAVAFAHARGIVHRDLKPDNVMVGPFGEVLVMDWGVAKLLSPSRERAQTEAEASAGAPVDVHEAETRAAPASAGTPGETMPGTVLGTPGYMAPEQAEGGAFRIDGRADVYALGVMLDELAEGAAEPRSRRLDAIVARAMESDPDARYPGVAELLSDVSRFVDGERVSAYRENPLDVAERWFHRYRPAILLILAYLAARTLIFLTAGS